MTVVETGTVWHTYRAERAPQDRNALVVEHLQLVRHVANRMRRSLPSYVDVDDLISDGVMGLMDAVEKFEPERGLTFQTYAVYRIRGAIIDSIRAHDWIPRSVRRTQREAELAGARLREELGREATDAEICGALGISSRKLSEALEATSIGLSGEHGLESVVDPCPGAEVLLEEETNRQLLMNSVKDLPARDQLIIALSFFEEMTLSEIGDLLGVSESRVCQLRGRALRTLRTELTAQGLGS